MGRKIKRTKIIKTMNKIIYILMAIVLVSCSKKLSNQEAIVEYVEEAVTEEEYISDEVVYEIEAVEIENIDERPIAFPDMEEETEDPIFLVVEEMPQFPGGEEALKNYIRSNIVYPKSEIDKETQGLVVVSFVVEKDGSISNIKILKSLSKNCDEESIRLVSAMPKWIPGKQRGQVVRVTINYPIRFSMQ